MIQAVLFEDEKGELIGFQTGGHSGYGQAGSDIVCAGVSTLVQAVLRSLERFLESTPREELVSDGEDQVIIRVLLPGSLKRQDLLKARVILGTLETGLQMMVTEYGDYIMLRRCRYDPGKV